MSHDRGYVTEKLPQAHVAGAVPLYWGDGVADSEVWNMRRVLLFDNSTSNAALLDTMLRLEHDIGFRHSWFEEPVLASGADAWLVAFMLQLAGHFRRALAAKGQLVHLPYPSASAPSPPRPAKTSRVNALAETSQNVRAAEPVVKTLVVTGFWPLADGAKHSDAKYELWIRNFALISAPTLVFCDPTAEARLRGAWSGSDTAVSFLPLALEDFYISTRARIDWEQQLRLDPELGIHSERLYRVWLERPALMLRALELFPSYTHFFWLDIGIFRDVIPQPGVFYLDQAVAACAVAEVTMLEIAPFADQDFELVDDMPHIVRAAPRMPDRISGGQFFGDAPALRRLAHDFYVMAQRLADKNIFMGKDQNVYAALYTAGSGRKIIRLLPPDGKENPWWTFPRMLTSPAGHPMCSTLPPPASVVTDATKVAYPAYPREFSVCTLSKNEHRYIPEWLEFHLIQGVSHFTIYDHGSQPAYSTAGFEDVLEVINAAALFPAECGVRHLEEHAQLRCQLAVFNHCVKRNVQLSRWVGIFDVDEFLFAQQSSSLVEFINAGGADAYHFKGVLFGNGWREKPPANEPGLSVPLLTAHFTLRQPCNVPSEHRHVFFDHKEVFNPRKLVHAFVHSHEYVAGVVPMQVDTCDLPTDAPGVAFFHYQYRSAEETVLKSIANNNTFLRLTDKTNSLFNSISDERATVFQPQLLSRLASKLQLVPNSSSTPSPPRVHLASFCGCAFEERRAAFIAEARESGLFDSVSVAALGDLDAAFRQQHAAILAHGRGCGYWIWKVKVALAVLASSFVRPGDVLSYVDCGCTFNASARPVFNAWVAQTLAAPSGLLGLQMDFPELDWTKADLLHFLGANNDASVTHTGQLLGGLWFIRVQPSSVTLLQRWMQVMTAEAYRFVDDSPSFLPNAPSFVEHRHDQSVWSVLRKQAGATVVADITYQNPSSPVRAARCTSAVCDLPSHPLPVVYPYANEEGLLGRDFFANGVERQIKELVQLSVDSYTLFVDVGANTGFYSLLAASLGSSVIAFEPQPHCAELIQATLRSANARLAHLIDFHTAAVGDAAGGSIRVPSTTCWGGFNAGATEHNAPVDAEVTVVSLASTVAPKPDHHRLFFKIDTEGAEVGVLKGVLKLRELHPERAIRVIVELIPRLWGPRGSSIDEGVDVLREVQRWFAVTLLYDDTGFGFSRLQVPLPGGIEGPAFDSFDLEALVHDRVHANAGCNLLLDYAPSAGLLSGKLRGGLGNQLFVMARVHSLAALTGRTAVVYGADLPASAHTPAGAYVNTVFARYPRTYAAPDLVVGENAQFVATSALTLPISAHHAHLDGYWQHESNVAQGFVSSLQLPAVPSRPHTAFVHVRRGDYVGSAMHDVGLVPAGYYAAAMQLLRDKARDPLLRFLVVSDDPEWCRQSGLFTDADVEFFDDGGDPVLSLMTMAACALGGVAANSTFSWWAAFLNSSPVKVIVFPLRWLNGFHGPIDVWFNGSYVLHPDGQAQLIQRPPPAPAPAPPSSLRAPPAFDLVLYINLDSRADKRTAVEAELAAVGWPGRRIAAIHKAPGELGCALSHIAALQLLLDQPSARHALVLEDDFVFVRDPRADVARFLDRFGADD